MTAVIALDAMGGDYGPSVVVEGVALALTLLRQRGTNLSGVRFMLFGDEAAIQKQVQRCPSVGPFVTVVHSAVTITNDMKPLEALRHRDDSSLGMALGALARGEAQAVVSAANTGAYVTLAKVLLGTLESIDRPAIPALIPNSHGRSVVLDLGANIDNSPERLVQFALMGEALARVLCKKEQPTVGLLNVGSEDVKGPAIVQETGHLLQQMDQDSRHDSSVHPFHFHGFVEGDDIFKGVTDVVVTDGFSGNIALKAIEGSIYFMFHLLKRAAQQSWRNKLAALCMSPLLKTVKKTIDPRLYNGAVFLGLKKIAVKSHGGADVFSFAQALLVAVDMAQSKFLEDIEKRLRLMTPRGNEKPLPPSSTLPKTTESETSCSSSPIYRASIVCRESEASNLEPSSSIPSFRQPS